MAWLGRLHFCISHNFSVLEYSCRCWWTRRRRCWKMGRRGPMARRMQMQGPAWQTGLRLEPSSNQQGRRGRASKKEVLLLLLPIFALFTKKEVALFQVPRVSIFVVRCRLPKHSRKSHAIMKLLISSSTVKFRESHVKNSLLAKSASCALRQFQPPVCLGVNVCRQHCQLLGRFGQRLQHRKTTSAPVGIRRLKADCDSGCAIFEPGREILAAPSATASRRALAKAPWTLQ